MGCKWIAAQKKSAVPVRSCRTRSWSMQLWTPTWELQWSCFPSSASTTHPDWWADCHSRPPADRREGHSIDYRTQRYTCKHPKCQPLLHNNWLSHGNMAWSLDTASIGRSFLDLFTSKHVIFIKPLQTDCTSICCRLIFTEFLFWIDFQGTFFVVFCFLFSAKVFASLHLNNDNRCAPTSAPRQLCVCVCLQHKMYPLILAFCTLTFSTLTLGIDFPSL